MKITVSKNELYNKLRTVGKIIQPNKNVPALENFKLECGEELRVTGADISGSISAIINCQKEVGSFTFLIDAKTILSALKEIPQQQIIIEVTGTRIIVKYSNGEFELTGYDSSAFPIIAIPDDASEIGVDKQTLLEGIKSVMPFTANDELRPVMNGVNFQSKDNKLTFVATDATKLGVHEYNFDSVEFNSIVPKKTAKIIHDMVSELDADMVTLIVSNKNIALNTGTYSLIYRLIEGHFPNFRGVIPTNNHISLQINRNDLMSAISRVSVFASRNTYLIKLQLDNDVLNITSQDVDFGLASKETIPVDYNGESLSIGFNGNTLLEVLGTINTEECLMTFSNAQKAALVTPVGVTGVTLLLMPLLINN